MKRTAKLFIAFSAMHFVQIYTAYDQLPETVASHFGVNNMADGFSSKELFVILHLLISGLLILVFGGMAFYIRKLPVSLLNLPRKDYWLAPERKERTFDTMENQLYGMGALTLIFLMFTFHMLVLANERTPPQLPSEFLWGFGSFMVAILGWALYFFRYFNKIQKP